MKGGDGDERGGIDAAAAAAGVTSVADLRIDGEPDGPREIVVLLLLLLLPPPPLLPLLNRALDERFTVGGIDGGGEFRRTGRGCAMSTPGVWFCVPIIARNNSLIQWQLRVIRIRTHTLTTVSTQNTRHSLFGKIVFTAALFRHV